MGSIYHILDNGTMINLKMDKPFIKEFDINDYGAFRMQTIQLAPFIRRFFKNVTTSGINLKYTKYDWLIDYFLPSVTSSKLISYSAMMQHDSLLSHTNLKLK